MKKVNRPFSYMNVEYQRLRLNLPTIMPNSPTERARLPNVVTNQAAASLRAFRRDESMPSPDRVARVVYLGPVLAATPAGIPTTTLPYSFGA